MKIIAFISENNKGLQAAGEYITVSCSPRSLAHVLGDVNRAGNSACPSLTNTGHLSLLEFVVQVPCPAVPREFTVFEHSLAHRNLLPLLGEMARRDVIASLLGAEIPSEQ